MERPAVQAPAVAAEGEIGRAPAVVTDQKLRLLRAAGQQSGREAGAALGAGESLPLRQAIRPALKARERAIEKCGDGQGQDSFAERGNP